MEWWHGQLKTQPWGLLGDNTLVSQDAENTLCVEPRIQCPGAIGSMWVRASHSCNQ